MPNLEAGDRLYPIGSSAIGHSLAESDGTLVLALEMRGTENIRLEFEGVLSYRFTPTDNYFGYIEDSLDKLTIPQEPAWPLRLADEDSVRGEFVRRRRFFHLNIDDVGIFECYALAVRRA